jgi:hypothetical protein
MPLHTDDPDRPGNLTDAEYVRQTQEIIDRAGDAGLHLVPEQVLAAAMQRLEAGQDG